jgi:hypothetical protein
MITKPSTLFLAKELTINATPGACNAATIAIKAMVQNDESGRNPVVRTIIIVVISQ